MLPWFFGDGEVELLLRNEGIFRVGGVLSILAHVQGHEKVQISDAAIATEMWLVENIKVIVRERLETGVSLTQATNHKTQLAADANNPN